MNKIVEKVNPKYANMVKNIRTYCGDLEGHKVLDIGADSKGELAKSLCAAFKVAHVTGINPVIKKDIIETKYSLLKGDGRNLQFADNYFDTIVSLAGFEHFFDLDKSLKELYRVLKPGGVLYTIFGPIWSSAWGHHLWAYYQGDCFNYSNTPLPAFCHLIMSEEELKKDLAKKISDPEKIACITNYVYQSKDQNRLFFSDYEKITYASPFDVLFFTGHMEVPYKNGYEIANYSQVLDKVIKQHPKKRGFGYNVISMLLKKNEHSKKGLFSFLNKK